MICATRSKIALALGDLRLALQIVHFLPQLVQCLKFYLFRMPFARKLVVLLLQLRKFLVDLLHALAAFLRLLW